MEESLINSLKAALSSYSAACDEFRRFLIEQRRELEERRERRRDVHADKAQHDD